MSLHARLSRTLRSNKWATVAYEIQKNLRSRARAGRGGMPAIISHGTTLGPPEARVAKSKLVFDLYLRRLEGGREALSGGRVLELGPGEDLAVALRFLAAGAEQVTCVDRFRFAVDPEWERAIYRQLLAELPEEEQRRLDGVVLADGGLVSDSTRLTIIRDAGIEDAPARMGAGRFGLIVSLAVLEHVHHLDASLRAMDQLLEPGGTMIHQVDLRDHGMFTTGGGHPLEFLTIPHWLYRLMSSHTGSPNRERVDTYRRRLDQLGYRTELRVSTVIGRERDLDPYPERLQTGVDVDEQALQSVAEIRRRMPEPFRSASVEDLAVAGILLIARKPRAGGVGELASDRHHRAAGTARP